jgi:hypothetical protein
MLIMIPESIHILVSARTLPHTTRKGAQTALGLPLDFTQLGFWDMGEVGVGKGEDGGGGKGGGWG